MSFTSEINTGITPNDGRGAGLRTNMRILIANDNALKTLIDDLGSDLKSIGIADLKDELKKTDVVISPNGTIDMGAGIMSSLFTMTEHTNFSFANPVVAKTFKALITGEYSSTWPAGVDTETAFANYNGTKINIVSITPIQLGDVPIYQVHNEPR